jgi:hypothetical protein
MAILQNKLAIIPFPVFLSQRPGTVRVGDKVERQK